MIGIVPAGGAQVAPLVEAGHDAQLGVADLDQEALLVPERVRQRKLEK